MVKQRKKYSKKKRAGKGFKKNTAKARKINASTPVETCTEHLSPFGGLLALAKFFDLFKFSEIFDSTYLAPRRDPKLGHHLMVVGILMLLFIGFSILLIYNWTPSIPGSIISNKMRSGLYLKMISRAYSPFSATRTL